MDGFTEKRALPTGRCSRRSSLLLDNDTFLGLEVESEEVELRENLAGTQFSLYWVPLEDGSLRGGYATEFALRKPLRGARLVDAVKCWCSHYKQRTDRSMFTYRCSTQIHLNLLDTELEEIRSMVAITMAADNYMHGVVDGVRRRNYNCRPLSLVEEGTSCLGELDAALAAGSGPAVLEALPGADSKYSGVNWATLGNHGTVEFRYFPGSANLMEILRWINLVFIIREAAARLTLDEVIDLVHQGPMVFGDAVFQEWWPNLLYESHQNDWAQVLDQFNHYILVSKTKRVNTPPAHSWLPGPRYW